ncbi:MAG: hypothetical protein HFE63_10600 [Clostridiales bacterium]|nr:hypothetical protein [Clostridiales bacterium]
MKKWTLAAIPAVLLSIALISGCTKVAAKREPYGNNPDTTKTHHSEDHGHKSHHADNHHNIETIGLDKARKLALAELEITDSDYTETKYELDDGKYEFEFICGDYEYECDIDAYTGKVMKCETERIYHHHYSSSSDRINTDKAREIALAHFELDADDCIERKAKIDDGEYEFKFICDGCEYECDIDAYTGKVLKSEIERKYAPDSNTSYIGLDKARELAIPHFELSGKKYIEKKAKLDDYEYEFEFICNGYEYECDIDAYTGKILKSEIEYDD